MTKPAWCTVVSNVVVKVFPKTKTGKGLMVRSGVRINLADGSWWFYSFKPGTWTQHVPGPVLRYKSMTPVTDNAGNVLREPERKYGPYKSLDKAIGHCPQLCEALREGLVTAA